MNAKALFNELQVAPDDLESGGVRFPIRTIDLNDESPAVGLFAQVNGALDGHSVQREGVPFPGYVELGGIEPRRILVARVLLTALWRLSREHLGVTAGVTAPRVPRAGRHSR